MTPEDIEKLIIADIKRFGGKIPKGTKFYWAKTIKQCMKQEEKKPHIPYRKINAKEKSKGRSQNYYQQSAQEQWDEDKRLGILDWDGN